MISFLNDLEIAVLRNFKARFIDDSALEKINLMAKKIRKDILTMIDNGGSGHIGGALSSTDLYLMLWLCADSTPANFGRSESDRIIISHGHTSAGLYAVLGNFGFFDVEEAVKNYRKQESSFEGHPNCHIRGVEWCSGSLGQGLSVGCGFAVSAKLRKLNNRVFVVMGDGEQQKGQITEAREFAAKHNLTNLTAIIDLNKLQASGMTENIMPNDIRKKYESSGWEVISIDGHNYSEIYLALKYAATQSKNPVAILANTTMGKGVSFIENDYKYHGCVLTQHQFDQAISELGDTNFEILTLPFPVGEKRKYVEDKVNTGTPIVYKTGDSVECRTAAGEAIYDLVKINPDLHIVVLDCDLVDSLKTGNVLRDFPDKFVECGIQEHNATTVAGALSKTGILPFFPGFGVFNIDETYGQHRMNDLNETSVKFISTHCGLDVGEDGKTHQCIDYISLINNLSGYKLILPADANQTDRVIRHIASTPGNFVVAVGRSKIPVLETLQNEPFYSDDYTFSYGNYEWIREGSDATIIATGTLVHKAVAASDALLACDIHAGVLNISCPGSIDLASIREACETGVVVTYEDHLVQSGIGSLVAGVIAENELRCRFKRMGIVSYGKSCNPDEQYKFQGLDVDSLQRTIQSLVQNKT